MTEQTLKPGMHIHLMGIGGFGISAIARVMHEQGFTVSGCDQQDSALIPPLRALGIPVEIGHSPAHLDAFTPDALVISSAIPESNPEVEAAHGRGIPVYKRSGILGALMREKTGIAVAGTHGKTTTTAMLAHTLDACGLAPTFVIGGVSKNLGTNARAGSGEAFVIEADEYDRMFMGLHPKIVVLTSLEMDHPDMFADLGAVRALFVEFLDLLPEDGLLVACGEGSEVSALAGAARDRGVRVLTYGKHHDLSWWIGEPDVSGAYAVHRARPSEKPGSLLQRIDRWPASLRIPGEHNRLNALAALAVAVELGIEPEQAIEALASFKGVGRRFEVKGEAGGVTVVDDYAHHPTAIRATLDAAHARYGDRPLWAVWQPHTFSRTKALLDAFADSFAQADHVVITDVYRSRDRETFGITPGSVLALMAAHPDARHVPGSMDTVTHHLAERVRPGDVVIIMSAGSATEIGDKLLSELGPAK